MATRHRIGTLAEIKEGEGKRFEIEGHRIAVFRRGPRVFAVGDACPHMGASLSDGYIDGGTVICPWHGWAYDPVTGAVDRRADLKIAVYPIKTEGEDVLVQV